MDLAIFVVSNAKFLVNVSFKRMKTLILLKNVPEKQ